MKTKTRLAAEYGVSPTTIHCDARFALAVHQLTENCGESARELILGRTAPLRRADVDKLVRLDPADQAEVLNQVRDFGRQALPWASRRDSDRITVPIDPAALARTVIERLGKTNAARVCDELTAQLASCVPEEIETTRDRLS